MKLRRVSVEVYVPTATCAGCGIERTYNPRVLHVQHEQSPAPPSPGQVPIGAFVDVRDCTPPEGWATVNVERPPYLHTRLYCAGCRVPGGET